MGSTCLKLRGETLRLPCGAISRSARMCSTAPGPARSRLGTHPVLIIRATQVLTPPAPSRLRPDTLHPRPSRVASASVTRPSLITSARATSNHRCLFPQIRGLKDPSHQNQRRCSTGFPGTEQEETGRVWRLPTLVSPRPVGLGQDTAAPPWGRGMAYRGERLRCTLKALGVKL